MQDNIPNALIAAFERHYDCSWDTPALRNERLAMRYGWAAAEAGRRLEPPTDSEIETVFARLPGGAQGFLKEWGYLQFAREILEMAPAMQSQCLHQIQEPAAAEQAAWHAGLDEGRAQAAPAAVAVPDGWKLVPTEPTPQMCHVGRYGGDKDAPAYGEKPVEGETAWPFVADHTAKQIYCAMLAAAPALAATPAAAQFVDQISANLIDKARSPETVIDKAAAPVVLPEPDAVISELMGLVDEWGMESHLRGEAELDAQHSEATQEEIDCAKDRASKERAAWKAIESKLRALLATATGLPAQAVLDYPWRDRLLDGRELVRDQQGFSEHPELPLLDEGMKPRAFFAALGVEMKHTMADDDLSMDEYDAMNDAENWSAWTPRPPIGDAWNLVAIFDTEDGPAAWWARAQKESREAAPQAQADARDAEQEVLMEHSGCGSNTQVDMLTVRLNPGDKVVMHKGHMTQAFDRANRAAIAAAKGE